MATRNRKSLPGAGALLDALPPRMASRRQLPALAVLPFIDLRAGEAATYLGEGLAEEALQALKRLPGLRLVSRTTSFLCAGLAPAEAGRRLGASYVLHGALGGGGERLTLRAELLEMAGERVVWSQAWPAEPADLLGMVEDLAAGVARTLRMPASRRSRPAIDLTAFECCLRGRQFYFRYNRHGMAAAKQMYRQALEADPRCAPAWAGLANCAAYTYNYLERSEAVREEAEACSLRALELDPELPEAHAARGAALSAAGRAEEAEAAFERSLVLDPDLFSGAYFYGRHCFAQGRAEMAIPFFEWAAFLRPEDYQAILLVAQAYHSLGLEDEAERCRREGLARVEQRLERCPDDVRARYMGANALVALGERERGLAWARQARAMDPADPMLLYNLGCIHALAGDAEEALDCLGWALAAGLTQKEWLLHDGDLDSIRDHPRFAGLVASLEG